MSTYKCPECGNPINLNERHCTNCDYDGYELGEIIEEWMADNTVNGKFNTVIATENHMLFENVCIPLQNEKGRDMDARRWIRELQRMLRDKYEIESKLTTKGLGEATLIMGSK